MMINRSYRRSGISVLDVFVSIIVNSILLALALPAVNSFRESSRRTTCRNNMRQLSAALQQYLVTFGRFPSTGYRGPSQAYLLPYLEQENVYETYVVSPDPWTQEEADNFPRIPVFQCPSDLNSGRVQGISYGENRGYCNEPAGRALMNPWPKYNGVFEYVGSNVVVRPASVRDGLSNTCVYAEICSTPRNGWSIYSTNGHDFVRCGAVTDLAAHCRITATSPGNFAWGRGSSWLGKSEQITGYMHVLPPNEKDCVFQPAAGSDHFGGVNTSLCDGSVRWIDNSVSDTVWQALGTIGSSDISSE